MRLTIENHSILCKRPLVSVIVITFQHAVYITSCLESLINQDTNFEYEILIGEDDSNDGTREICVDYAKKYPDKIRLFLRDSSDKHIFKGRVTERKNLVGLIECARGKYLAFCEGDDYWCNNLKLQEQIDGIKSTQSTYSYHDVRVYYQNIKSFHSKSFISQVYNGFEMTNKNISLIDIYFNRVMHLSSLIIEKPKSIPDFFWRLPYGDIGIFALAVTSGKGFYYNKISSVYRKHNAGWSATRGFSNGDKFVAAFEIDRYYGGKNLEELITLSIKYLSETVQFKEEDFKNGRVIVPAPLKVLFYNIKFRTYLFFKRKGLIRPV